MKRSVLSATLGLALAAGLAVLPTTAAAAPAAPTAAAVQGYTASTYAGSAQEAADNQAFFQAVMASAKAKQAANPGLATVVVTYDASSAPSFRTQIANAAQIWNSSVSNVQLRAGSAADFRYYEGNDSRGSYASTDGHGRGYVFLDYQQNRQYNSVRVTAHETGHVLGLPDHYSGPCSELMSGGGPGTSCTNPYPNATERSRVNSLWARG
ncbi:snapalysin [Kitasatospora aureofaciens]|uniref:Extracellular small neutral protease n=1 Tax=Kitasatospora aureofaciens TaxID=1894 RepID=A0A8H9HYE1_KITAU|nr:snapalysin [Kitasatospora aureofaciens]QEV01520.1 snapalysin [Streptomyces viridifaciens]UKZ07926.1 snapalysin [Streptomyces viridifaciens]GGU98069.1 extracellular small neutral protease [Kitasatospora aureofaciens]HJD81277.1 snapalysin [Kitasatospora aureofaciens]